jgi:hypothetical protein
LGFLGAVFTACSASSGSVGSGRGRETGGGGASNEGAGGTVILTPGAGGSGFNVSPSGGASGSVPGPDGSCAVSSAKAERVTTQTQVEVKTPAPVAVYIMQDQSLSMLGPKWTSVQQAIQAFTTDPSSAGIDVAIKFFAEGNPLDCTGTGYDQPDAPIGTLPGNAQAINGAVSSHFPSTVTPIEPALRGGIQFCKTFEQNHPNGEKCVLVFITDGVPDLCDGNPADLAQIAADGKNAGVLTFTVGMDGADFNMLSSIARGGGTDCTPQTTAPGDEACDVRAGTQAFVDALNAIRGTITTYQTHTEVQTTTLDCEFTIPPPPDGQQFDRDKVNVQLTVDTTATHYARVAAADQCAQAGNQGWYYDDPNAPTKIEVCPDTCTAIKTASADPAHTAQVDVLLGCATDVFVQ